VIFSDQVAAVFSDANTPFLHNLTYEAHPLAAAAALAVLEIIERDELIENAARQGEHLLDGPAARRDRAADRGRPWKGLLTAIELVADRETKRPFDAALGVTKRLHALARRAD
jgi:adenosylmethionine-8-amino-7-oxononanoate aminotransferase